jgi:hypothetical protein
MYVDDITPCKRGARPAAGFVLGSEQVPTVRPTERTPNGVGSDILGVNEPVEGLTKEGFAVA